MRKFWKTFFIFSFCSFLLGFWKKVFEYFLHTLIFIYKFSQYFFHFHGIFRFIVKYWWNKQILGVSRMPLIYSKHKSCLQAWSLLLPCGICFNLFHLINDYSSLMPNFPRLPLLSWNVLLAVVVWTVQNGRTDVNNAALLKRCQSASNQNKPSKLLGFSRNFRGNCFQRRRSAIRIGLGAECWRCAAASDFHHFCECSNEISIHDLSF